MLELVELLDGPLGSDVTGSSPPPPGAARDMLAATTIADVVERANREAGAAMYYI